MQRTTREFFVQDWLNHQEALELLLCYEHIADLKYGIDKDGRNILAVTPSTMIMNRRFLGYIACARRNFPNRQKPDHELIKFLAELEQKFPALFTGASAALQLSISKAAGASVLFELISRVLPQGLHIGGLIQRSSKCRRDVTRLREPPPARCHR